MSTTVRFEDYRFEVRPLAAEEGGGFLVSFPDLPGCMSDGESYEEAILNARDAFESWVAAYQEEEREIPAPNGEGRPAKFVLRLPRELHERLTLTATADGVSVNTTVIQMVAEGLARRQPQDPYPFSQTAVGLLGVSATGSSVVGALADLHVTMLDHSSSSFFSWGNPDNLTGSTVKRFGNLALANENSHAFEVKRVAHIQKKRVAHG